MKKIIDYIRFVYFAFGLLCGCLIALILFLSQDNVCDTNKDGKVNSQDYVLINEYITVYGEEE